MKDLADFKKIPFGTYEMMKDYIMRVKDGDCKAFTNDPVLNIAYTSGTTGGKKYWPYTKSVAIPHAKAVKEYNVFRRVSPFCC